MKNKKSFPNFFFHPIPMGLIIILLLFFNSIVISQEHTPPVEFPIGSGIQDRPNRTNQIIYDSYAATGMNIIAQHADDITRPFLIDYELQAVNMDTSADYIYHYSTAYYSKWEAEVDQDTPYIGVKHKYGEQANWNYASCWSTIGMTSPGDSLLFGPHYHQEKWYRRWLYNDTINMKGNYDVRFIPRWRIALDTTNSNLGPDDEVCRLSVWVRNGPLINGVWNGIVYDHKLKESSILKVSDFSANGQFKYFYLSENPDERWYRYPKAFQSPVDYYNLQELPTIPNDTVWVDIYGNNGVEFRVEWLRSDAKCTLYVDYVEVYDDFGWRQYIENPELISNRIKAYADSFKTMGWSNIKYWVGCDEPFTIDSYIPIRTVDSLLRSINAPPLIVNFYPYWNVFINSDSQIVRYYKTAKPDPLNIHFFPFSPLYPTPRFDDWDTFRKQLQISYTLTKEKGFWYKAQNFGCQQGENWILYRQPDSSEHKAEVMLALAHGVKGLTLSHYDSFTGNDPKYGSYILQGLIGMVSTNYDTTDLWYLVKNSFVPRLKGKLGKTLMSLNYSGNFLQYRYQIPTHDNPAESGTDYLILGYGIYDAHERNWHCGFFDRPGQTDNKYFLLANLYLTAQSKTVRVKVISLNQDYTNWRFRNVEGLFDETFTNYIIKDLNHPKGEGYLYQVAPVIKYGGRLLYSESTQSGMILNDDMIIENGAELTINGTYFAKGNITVKNGGIINGSNGKIQFVEGRKLIIEGSGSIVGTSNNKLELEFSEPVDDDPIGIIVKSNDSLTINNCKIENATIGINSLLNANYLNVQNTEFIDCADYSISIAGRSSGMIPPPADN